MNLLILVKFVQPCFKSSASVHNTLAWNFNWSWSRMLVLKKHVKRWGVNFTRSKDVDLFEIGVLFVGLLHELCNEGEFNETFNEVRWRERRDLSHRFPHFFLIQEERGLKSNA